MTSQKRATKSTAPFMCARMLLDALETAKNPGDTLAILSGVSANTWDRVVTQEDLKEARRLVDLAIAANQQMWTAFDASRPPPLRHQMP